MVKNSVYITLSWNNNSIYPAGNTEKSRNIPFRNHLNGFLRFLFMNISGNMDTQSGESKKYQDEGGKENMIEKLTDVKLNVRPIFIGLVHQYYYEGPCRFGKGEELEKEYDVMMNQELFKQFREDVTANMPSDIVNVMDPIYVERDDWFRTKEDMFREMAKDIGQVDYFLFSFGIGRGDIYLEFAQRYHKPQGVMPAQCCEATVNTSAVRARGLEAYAYRSWEELRTHMRVLRTRKVLASARVLVVTRFNSSRSFSSSDNFVDLNMVTEKFGVQFRYVNVHELMDQLTVRDPKTNPSLPGREAANLTEEDMKEVERLADGLIAGAENVRIERDMLVKTLKGYVLVQKLLDLNGCNAYTMPCPDCCSTRRLNQEQLTFCMTHSLNNENGIPSSCEMDINSVLAMTIMESLSGNAVYMGNANPVLYHDGKMVTMQGFGDEELSAATDEKEDLYLIFHSTPNRKLRGYDKENAAYSLAPFANDQGFGATIRYDFTQDAGQEITLMRIAPDAKKMFVGKGTILAGSGSDRKNCDQGFFMKIANQKDFFYKHINFGNHLTVTYGNYEEELKALGDALGLEVVTA